MEAATPLSREVKPCEFSTRRLVLRPLCADDAPGMYAIYSDPETMKYWSTHTIRELEQAARMVGEDLQLQMGGTAAFWAIVLPKTGRVIGKFTLFNIHRDNDRAEIGYVIHRQFWRKGYGAEVLDGMLKLCFERFALHRLEADIDPENTASLALLAKFGFRQEGLCRERWHVAGQRRDSLMMALLAPAWRLSRMR